MDKLTEAGWPSFSDQIYQELQFIWMVSVDHEPKVWTDSKEDLSIYIQATIDACKNENCEQSVLQQESLSKSLMEEKPLTINLYRSVRSWFPGRTTEELAHTIHIERIPKITTKYLQEEE